MKTDETTTEALASLANERVYGRVRVTATLPDADEAVSDPVVFIGHATEINEESDDRGGRTIRVNFGFPSVIFLDATGAAGFELTATYNPNGEREQIGGRYLIESQEKMTLRYGEIRVHSVASIR